ncbi:uncharacterized protein PHALS_10782 [Plasmopara halstedii]|uniref:Uncharacterized protein n=1 Tax=Plasmopara halstedii TaxID=4781 RepID=A0A0N7L563_PLAHL|nr:uncharacterized protein PHALS_10782 [Plasmopara halstedii]CEG40595.1 hypothetical protein PHALS_10782 [Plasmopara halstedii]|eukprot:XP_024576964.1 hypothetical protein PHALS_10782 [Plasmopara halstedii]
MSTGPHADDHKHLTESRSTLLKVAVSFGLVKPDELLCARYIDSDHIGSLVRFPLRRTARSCEGERENWGNPDKAFIYELTASTGKPCPVEALLYVKIKHDFGE